MWLVLAAAGTLFSWRVLLAVELCMLNCSAVSTTIKKSHVQSVITTSALAVTQPSSARRQPHRAQREDNSNSHLSRFSASPLLNSSPASASKAKISREGVWSARGEEGVENTSGINSK